MKFLVEYNEFEYKKKTRSEELTKEQFLELISKHCTQYTLNNTQLYRGVREGRKISSNPGGKSDYLKLDPRGKRRVSIEPQNVHTFIMDNLPAWKDYPKRSESVIATTSDGATGMYGYTYVVIPFDNVKIGICPSYSIWGTFGNARITETSKFFEWLSEKVKGEAGYFDFQSSDMTDEEFKRKLNEISDDMNKTITQHHTEGGLPLEQVFTHRLFNSSVTMFLINYCEYKETGKIETHMDYDILAKHLLNISGEEIYNYLNDFFFNPNGQRRNANTYEGIDFQLVNYSNNFDISPRKQSGYAVWTEGPVLMIKFKDWEEIKHQLPGYNSETK
jgi:hypothetical protein